MSNLESFPKLIVTTTGSSSLEIKCKFPEKFFCGEFTLRDDVPQTVLYAPWLQFEPVKLAEFRHKMANEIARRAEAHDMLVEEIDRLQKNRELDGTVIDRLRETQRTAYRLWGDEREKLGLPKDFSDIKEWPPEMMSGYEYSRDTP